MCNGPLDPGMGISKLQELIQLPPPRLDGDISVEAAMRQRRSVRQYRRDSLTLDQVSQILWAAQGMTHHRGFRTVPSAGALYPLEIYLAAGRVADLGPGVYRYQPQGHRLEVVVEGNHNAALAHAALGQKMVAAAAANLVVCAVYSRMTSKYGLRGEQYVHMEAGHAGQNIALQCEGLGLGCVMVGAFADDQVQRVIGALPTERPLYLIPIGRPQQTTLG